jgi:ubiquinone/menaquinone biosynthesis C-methylase UbiE
MNPSARQLHKRYQIQASWTNAIRNKLYAKTGLSSARRVLEVGSGTGVLTAEISDSYHTHSYGIDVDSQATKFARELDRRTRYLIGDGMALPFKSNTFGVTFCHFLLMWVSDPLDILHEMARVTVRDGHVLALAEPDYGGRIDYPSELSQLGRWQGEALASLGANPTVGRKLRALFTHTGLTQIQVGVLGGEWTADINDDAIQSEWETLNADLGDSLSDEVLQHLQRIDDQAWQEGTRILYVPTFYAYGRVA